MTFQYHLIKKFNFSHAIKIEFGITVLAHRCSSYSNDKYRTEYEVKCSWNSNIIVLLS